MITTAHRQDLVIITVAPTGGGSSKAMNPAVPEQPDEIIQATYEAYNEGAALVHLHARDRGGKATGDLEVFGKIHDGIRAKCNIVIQDSTGGGPGMTLQQRLACLTLKPEMASLNMGTLVAVGGPNRGSVFANVREDIETWAAQMLKYSIKPEMELFNQSLFREVENLIAKNLLHKPYLINITLGGPDQGQLDATPKNLLSMLEYVPQGSEINVSGAGTGHSVLITVAIALGCSVRVGMEDTIYYRPGELAKSNAELVARAVRIAKEIGREPATPAQAREILGLKS